MTIITRQKIDILWSLINTYGSNVLSFLFTLVLARLVSPSDFGLVALTVSYITLASVLVDGGIIAAAAKVRL